MTLWDIGGKPVLVFQPADSDEVIAKLSVDTVEGAKLDFFWCNTSFREAKLSTVNAIHRIS